jgi:hypothetical protein
MIGCPQLVEIFLYAAGEDDRDIVGEAAPSPAQARSFLGDAID